MTQPVIGVSVIVTVKNYQFFICLFLFLCVHLTNGSVFELRIMLKLTRKSESRLNIARCYDSIAYSDRFIGRLDKILNSLFLSLGENKKTN
jgi:hypothetical protein